MVIEFNTDMELEVFYSENQVKPDIEKFTAGTQMDVNVSNESEVELVTGGVTFVTKDFWANVKILQKD